jgi:hypothetical protein
MARALVARSVNAYATVFSGVKDSLKIMYSWGDCLSMPITMKHLESEPGV